MQVDKESLIKYHFWILLGVYMPLALVGLLLLWTSVSGAVDEAATNLKKTKDDLKGANKPDHKNEKWKDELVKKEDVLVKQKNAMWEQVWNAQASIMQWPVAMVQKFPELKDAYFLDPLKRDLRDKFVHDNADGYYSQLLNENSGIPFIVEPVDNKGVGVVQYKDGWQSVIQFVPNGPQGGWPDMKQTGSDIPDSEDCWLAQEDLWVQRELLLVIREANDMSAYYKKLPDPPAKKKDELDRQIFTNSRWKLDLTLLKNGIRWQLTNISTRRQQVGMGYYVKRSGVRGSGDYLWIDGEPLAPHQSSKVNFWPFGANLGGLQTLESVKEDLDWRSATVKRIDRLDLAHHSHRTYTKGLTAIPSKDDPNAAAAAAAPAAAPAMAGGPGGDPAAEAGGPGMGGMMAKPQELVPRERYIDVNDQVRRMAIGMLLIVDQSRIQDVMTALANSRLRVQITQVHWDHYQGSIKPVILDDKSPAAQRNFTYSGGGDRPQKGFSRFSGGGDFEAGARGPMRGGPPPGMLGGRGAMPGGLSGAGADADLIAVNDESANTVELAIYGIASLYQKYPPKPPDAPGGTADPAAAGAAGTPGAAPK